MIDLSTAKYGDQFRVREDLVDGIRYGQFMVTPNMLQYKGKVVTVAQRYGYCCDSATIEIIEDDMQYFWTGEMLEYAAPPVLLTNFLTKKV